MGQRTQIVLVEDVLFDGDDIGYRYVTAHHDQWGYGRPVLFDVMAIFNKISTGAYMCPRFYSADGVRLTEDAYKQRTLLHHCSPCDMELEDIYNGGVMLRKGDSEWTKSGVDFIQLFDYFDNNNGGAVVWIVHKNKDYHYETYGSYGCLIGPEDSDTPFEGFVDGLTYLRKVNKDMADESFVNYWKGFTSYYKPSLLYVHDTLETIMIK